MSVMSLCVTRRGRQQRQSHRFLPVPWRSYSSIIILLTLVVSQAWCCSVPVFRYALERWPPSNYVLWIFHNGAMTAELKQLASDVEQLKIQDSAKLNVNVVWADVTATLSPEAAAVWNEQSVATFPYAVLQFAPLGKATGTAYHGSVNREVIHSLFLSPTRQLVVEKLLGGDSAVWLFIESGDSAADDSAFERLSSTLTVMEKSLKLPEIDPTDGDVYLDERKNPLRISFPIVRVSRNDAAESGLISILTAAFIPHPSSDQPFTVAVSGQGRAIGMMAGEDIDPGYIGAWCDFIAGPCSCQVKEELPGSDLLMRADWTRLPDGKRIKDPEVPNVAVVNEFNNSKKNNPPTSTTASSDVDATAVSSTKNPLLQRLVWIAVIIVLLLSLITWFVVRRGQG